MRRLTNSIINRATISSLRIWLLGISIRDWIIRIEIQADAVHAMPLIRWSGITFALENVSQMPTTIAAYYFCSLHSKCAICMSRNSAWDVIEICRPTAARLEFVVCFVEWRIATSTRVDACFGHMLVILAGKWSFSALLSKNAELF